MIKYIVSYVTAASFTMFFISAIIIVLLFKSKVTNTPIYVNPKFNEYLDLFNKDAARFKVKPNMYKLVTIFSPNLSTNTLAYCLPSSNTVVVSRKAWDGLTFLARKALLYHEWGHCTLKRDHVEDFKIPYSFCPVSMMYPYLDNIRTCYIELEEEYIVELFTNPHNYPLISRRDL